MIYNMSLCIYIYIYLYSNVVFIYAVYNIHIFLHKWHAEHLPLRAFAAGNNYFLRITPIRDIIDCFTVIPLGGGCNGRHLDGVVSRSLVHQQYIQMVLFKGLFRRRKRRRAPKAQIVNAIRLALPMFKTPYVQLLT